VLVAVGCCINGGAWHFGSETRHKREDGKHGHLQAFRSRRWDRKIDLHPNQVAQRIIIGFFFSGKQTRCKFASRLCLCGRCTVSARICLSSGLPGSDRVGFVFRARNGSGDGLVTRAMSMARSRLHAHYCWSRRRLGISPVKATTDL
jgi:hypothetical protein